VKRILYLAATTALLAGCEASTDPLDGVGGGPPGGGAITQAQASGEWTLTLDRTSTSCSVGSLPDNQVLIADLDVISNGSTTGSLLGTTSGWRTSQSAAVRDLDGTLSFSSGFATLVLRGSTAGTGMELRGTFTSAGAFTGTLSDPSAGLLPVFGSGACAYNASGVKTG
jgi:hypothetical protein